MIASVTLFAWGASLLGTQQTIARALGILVGAIAAVSFRDLATKRILGIIEINHDIARIIAVVILFAVGFLAVGKVASWYTDRKAEVIDENGDLFEAEESNEAWDDRRISLVIGGLVGLAWALVFVSMWMLSPRDSVLSRAAIASNTGSLLVRQESMLRWFTEGFPRFAQSLPKGEFGGVVGENEQLKLKGDVVVEDALGDADELHEILNRIRVESGVTELAWNPELAGIAQRHARDLGADRVLRYESATGNTLDSFINAALGSSAAEFEDDPGIVLIWSHSPKNAARALIENKSDLDTLRGSAWSEVGIGAVDLGWFNGRIYVVLMIAPVEASAMELNEDEPSTDDSSFDDLLN